MELLFNWVFICILFNKYLLSEFASLSIFYNIILWYPCFENLFSILRKIKFKKSAAEPDTKHFHHYYFTIFSKL